nr:unnamed protein product [Callosobruchus chinensis]
METYPAALKPDFMGPLPPNPLSGYGLSRADHHMSHFQNFRNQEVSRMMVPRYEWGGMEYVYTPHPDVSAYKKAEKYLNLPPSNFSMIDRIRHQEVDDFYVAAQIHRDQYKDDSGRLHPMDYFKVADYAFQCPKDPTSRYLKYPEYYVKYKQPIALPLTLERSLNAPLLPQRALTGVYNPSSDIAYKR